MFGYIYKTTNLINSKIYIGQHVAEIFDTYYKGSGQMLKRAFKKYGKENFKCELLAIADSKKELDILEQYWIEKLDARNPTIGYNIVAGGGGTVGYRHTNEAKAAMSTAKKGKPLNLTPAQRQTRSLQGRGRTVSNETKEKIRFALTGRKLSEETKQKLREAHRRNPRKLTEEHRRKIGEALTKARATGRWSISEEGMENLRKSGSRPKSAEHRKHVSETRIERGIAAGAKNPRAKKIYCVETDTVYSWAGEAAKVLGLSVHLIRQCRQGKIDNVKGYHFTDFIEK